MRRAQRLVGALLILGAALAWPHALPLAAEESAKPPAPAANPLPEVTADPARQPATARLGGPGGDAAASPAAGKPLIVGADMTGWKKPTGDWKVVGEAATDAADEKAIAVKPGEGVLYNGPKGRTGNLFTESAFGDIAAHVEFMIPKGSNSGIYFLGRYEIQVYDSFGVEKGEYPGIECGGIYQRWDATRGAGKEGFEGHSPRVNASRKPGEWQTFDVIFRAPRFDADGRKTAHAKFVKVVHNGQVIHENVELTGPTRGAAFNDEKPTGPLMFQGDHGPVAYRNLKVVALEK